MKNTKTIKSFTAEQRKELRIVKSHKLVGGLYKVTYCIRDFKKNTVTEYATKIVENIGGVKFSLLSNLV